MYKDFDWEVAKTINNPIKYNYLKNYWDKEVSEEQFVQDWKLFKPFSKLHSFKGKKNAGMSKKLNRNYSASSLRGEYRNLQKKFGFFIGNKN